MTNSHIKHGSGGTVFVGADSTALFRALTIASALKIYAQTGIRANRLYTPTRMLKSATGFTGKAYKRGQYLEAANDLRTWAYAMKAALPVVEG